MRVFITGGTGYIGSAIVRELASAGHEVTALSRSPDKSAHLERLSATPIEGDINDPSTYQATVAGHDAVVHAAMDYMGDPADMVKGDATAIDALLGAAAEGQVAGLVYTSGCWVMGDTAGQTVDEDSPVNPPEIVAWRPAHEEKVLTADTGRFATSVIRPGMVYGGTGSLTASFFTTAEEEGAAAFVGDGENHWSMVHRSDLARLYRMVIEEHARGIFHGVDGHPVRVKHIAHAASDAVGVGGFTRSVAVEQAREQLGPIADTICMDQLLAGHRSAELGWRARLTSFPDHAEEAYRELIASRH